MIGRDAPHVALRRQGYICDVRQTLVNAPAAQVFGVLQGLGGKSGWPYANLLWQNARMDRSLAGRRRHVGEAAAAEPRCAPVTRVDFWRVEEVAPGERISFRAEMKLPGRAWLQFILRAESTRPHAARAATPGSNLEDWPASFIGHCCIPFTC